MDPVEGFRGNQLSEARPMSKNKLLEKYFYKHWGRIAVFYFVKPGVLDNFRRTCEN